MTEDILNIALQNHKAGNIEIAKKIYIQILDNNPDHADACDLLGLIFHDEGLYDKADKLICKAIALNPSNPHYYTHWGNTLRELNRIEEAIAVYKKAIQIEPFNSSVYDNLGNALQSIRLFDQAVKAYQISLKIDPNSHLTHNNLGTSLKAQGRFDEAITAYSEAIKLSPNFAEAHSNLSKVLLLQGNWGEGWKQHEWRIKHSSIFKNLEKFLFSIPVWDGSVFEGKRLLVHYEQGYGDTINFVRYLPYAKKLGGKVIFVCQDPLIKLLTDFPGIDQLLSKRSFDFVKEDYDYYVPLLSLPYLFNTDIKTIPKTIPYLKVNQKSTLHWQQRFSNEDLKVGIVWSSNPKNLKLSHRSIELQAFERLGSIQGITFYSLQKGPASEMAKFPPGKMKLIDVTMELNDFYDTAALMDKLDLIISVDTSVAHLAGAMGKKVWVLLYRFPDWRWLLDRDDTPWYPTMRLFRQQKEGDWNEPLNKIYENLCLLAFNHRISR